jgi:hypothetical protein
MEEELIVHVRSRPLLYDPSNWEYRNQNVRKVKVKMGVSEIVFLAELNSTKNITQFNNNYQYQHLPSPSKIDSSVSFSSAANTPTLDASPAPQQEYDLTSFFRNL